MLELEEDEDDDDDDEDEDIGEDEGEPGDESEHRAVAAQIARLLQGRGPFRNMIFRIGSRNVGLGELGGPRQRGRLPEQSDLVPSLVGQELMRSGDFGAVSVPSRSWKLKRIGAKADTSQDELQSYRAAGASKKTASYTLSRRLLEREIGSYTGERARILNQLMAQASSTFMLRHRQWMNRLICYSPCCRAAKPTSSSIMKTAPTLANSQRMEISSTAVPRTSVYECTTRLILMNGNTTSPWIILVGGGRLQMHLYHPITATWPTAVLRVVCS